MRNHRDRKRDAAGHAACRAVAALAVSFVLAGGAATAVAQDIRPFQLESFGGFVGLGFLTDLERRDRSGTDGSDFDRIEFSQYLEMNADAYVYHPRFLTMHGGIRFEAIEEVIGNSDNRILVGGDWRFDFLQKYRDNLSTYGNVSQSQAARPFSTTYEVMSQLYGATWNHGWGWVPFRLTYQHRSMTGGDNDEIDETTDEVLFSGEYALSEQSDGDINYSLVFEDYFGQESREQALNLSNLTYFGEGSDKVLSTYLLLNEHEDDFHSNKVAGNTAFDWQHTDRLATRYTFNGMWYDTGNQTITLLNPSFNLRHQLYQSLSTRFEAWGRFRDASFGKRNAVAGIFSENYTKELGEWGRLGVGFSSTTILTYTRPDQETAEVIDERHQMTSANDHCDLLDQPFVIESSIDVFFPNGIVYPYDTMMVGTETELCLIGVPVGEDVRVLVDYVFELNGRSDVLSQGFSVDGSLWFLDHVGLYGRYQNRQEHVLSGEEESLRLNPFDRQLAGVEVTWPWLTAKAEYENYDANFGPFRQLSGSFSVFTFGRRTWRARFNAGYGYRELKNTDENVQRLKLGASARRRLFRRGQLELHADYLRERWSSSDQDSNDRDAVNVRSLFTWWYGLIQVRLEGKMVQIFERVEDRSVYQVNLRVRRSF